MAETLCFDYSRMHGVSVVVARIFNTYGPRMSPSDGRVVTNFISQALRCEPLTIYGSGDQTRSFCYCDDLVDGLLALMNHVEVEGPVNLGNPDEITISELARRVTALVHPGLAVVHQPLPIDDPQRRRPSIERAEMLLGWHPVVDLNHGLQATIAGLAGQPSQGDLIAV